MSSSGSTTPQPPRRTINDLPVELKKRIVELVAEQDKVLEDWTTAIRPHLDALLDHQFAGVVRRYQSGVGALFCVSREFSDLAAPFRFKVLKASKADLRFQMAVSHSRAQYITRIEFDSGDPQQLGVALAYVSRASKILEVAVDAKAFAGATPISPVLSPSAYYERSLSAIFRGFLFDASKTVPHLELRNFAAAHAKSVLREWASSLRFLRLELDAAVFLSGANALVPALAEATKLEKLELEVVTPAEETDPPVLSLSTWFTAFASPSPRPPLRHLRISAPFFDSSVIRLSHQFASTLQCLSLHSTGSDEEPDIWAPPAFADEQFPLVEKLSLRMRQDTHPDMLRSIKKSVFPALIALELNLSDLPNMNEDDIPGISSALAELSHIDAAYIHNGARLHPCTKADVQNVCSQHRIRLFDHPPLPVCPSYPTSNANLPDLHRGGWSDELVEACRPYVEELSAYLADEVEQAQRNNDEASFVSLAYALRGLELEKLIRRG